MAQIIKVNAAVDADPSVDVAFPSLDVLDGRLVICSIKSTKKDIKSSGLRRSQSWPRINPRKKIPKAAPRKNHSWPRTNTRKKIPGRLDEEFDVPESVTILENAQGSKVFLVGTEHVSKESAVDVAETIQEVQPDALVIELCELRLSDILLTEEESKKYLDEYKGASFIKAMREHGIVKGVIRGLFQDLQISIGKKLGALPGGEFRRAILEAKKIPGCDIRLGDRSIYITLDRAYASLSFRQSVLCALVLLLAKLLFSQLEPQTILDLKNLPDAHEEKTSRISIFSKIDEVLLTERDLILTYAMQQSAESGSLHPRYVVGVVGRGHVPGIKRNWGKVTKEDILPLFRVPEQKSWLRTILQGIVIPSIILIGLYGFDKLFQFIRTLFP